MNRSIPGKYTYVYFKDAAGKHPVEEYVKGCQVEDRTAFFKTLVTHVEKYDPMQPPPHKIIHKVEEFTQIRFGPHRCLAMVEKTEFLLLHAFRKKTDETPAKEKNIARKNLAKHKELKKQEEAKAKAQMEAERGAKR